MISDHDDEVIRAMDEWKALHREYLQKYVSTEPVPHNQDVKRTLNEECLELMQKIEAAEQRFKELRKLLWHY